jgi:hypothetical protein
VRIDLYTRAMLTIIAACLIYLVLGGQSLFTPAHAASERTPVLISGWVDANGNVQELPAARDRIRPLPVDTFQR